jgi:peptidoglycan/LPS O-acetylase OafA/YrhL
MKEIISLTSLRGVAASVVVIYHLAPRICDGFSCESPLPFFSNGQLMVDLFFILSGFILAHAYPWSGSTHFAWSEVKIFFLRRFARVYPAHIFMLTVFLAYELVDVALHQFILDSTSSGVWFTDSTSPESLLTNLLLLHSWGLHDTLTWNQPSWSISAEMAAYLIFPILAWWSPFRRSRWFALAVAALSIALLAAIQWKVGHLTGGYKLGVLVCIAEFAIGMALYFWISPFRYLGEKALSFVQFLIFAGIILGMTFYWLDLLLVILFGLLIVSCRDDNGWLGWLLARPILVWLGRISYSLYITHYIFIRLFEAPWEGIFPVILTFTQDWNIVVVLVEAALILVFAWVTYTLVEAPGRRWIRNIFSTQ